MTDAPRDREQEDELALDNALVAYERTLTADVDAGRPVTRADRRQYLAAAIEAYNSTVRAAGGEPHGLPGEPTAVVEAHDRDDLVREARDLHNYVMSGPMRRQPTIEQMALCLGQLASEYENLRLRASGAATHGERDALAHVASEIEGQLKHGELSSAPWGTRMYWSQIVAVARAALAASPAPESPFRDVVHALVWAADHDMFSRQTIRDLGTILESARDALNRATSEAPRGEK